MRHFLAGFLSSGFFICREDRMVAGTALKWWTVMRNKGILQLVAVKVGAGNPAHLVGYIGSTVCRFDSGGRFSRPTRFLCLIW